MKVAIITGGSNGIGKGTAIELSKRGVGVIITYHSHPEAAEALLKELNWNEARAAALRLDLNQPASFANFTEQVKKTLHNVWGRTSFDYLINNGGMGGGMPFTDVTEQFFDQIMTTNFKGPYFLTQHLLGLLEDGGRIVNTSSNSSYKTFAGYSTYGPSKAAMAAWTRYLAKELAPRRILVNAISPGPTHTNIGDGVFEKHPEYLEPLAKETALGRIGRPDDMAKVIASLVSDDFGWVTAQDIEVSGGHIL